MNTDRNYKGISPTFARVLIVEDPKEGRKIGNIFVAETTKMPILKGTVVAVGPGRVSEETYDHIPVKLKVGDRVAFGANAATRQIEHNGVNVLVMDEIEVLAILSGENSGK